MEGMGSCACQRAQRRHENQGCGIGQALGSDQMLESRKPMIIVMRTVVWFPAIARKEAWADAYRSTPHGMPVKLTTGSDG